jgi:two-component system, sensor histidine kinase RegB
MTLDGFETDTDPYQDQLVARAPQLMDANSLHHTAQGRVRLLTLVLIRWFALIGQLLAILIIKFAMGFDLPLGLALAAVGASALLNVAVSVRYAKSKRLSNREAAVSLAYDIVQLAALLFLTGGLGNPFSILFLVPVTISATVLSLRSTLWLGVLALVCISVLAGFHMPLPWQGGSPHLPQLYLTGIWAALVLGMGFISVYAWRVAEEARRMANALAETQHVLAREQKMSALGGLAAAAAHELGTPLGTIALVAKEVASQLPAESEMAEDMALISSQTARCREILGQLSRTPEAGGLAGEFSRVGLATLMEEAADSYRTADVRVDIAVSGEPWAEDVPRHPEVLHGLANFIENAADFARSSVTVQGHWDEETLQVTVADDGPGFSTGILSHLGEPYISSRQLDDDGGGGLGLGVFIAKTLLERTGSRVKFSNRRGGGAEVVIIWPRSALVGKEARSMPGGKG